MRIQHNIMAMNSYRNYNSNISGLSTNLEKLSSGYRINRAGDDAAGLAISEKMRAQITGLDAAQKNVKDGISLVKTAEGALQEVQDMLNRSVYLATQSANGTYDNEVDRKNLQKELDALKSEIDRIADSSNFNGKKLLNGDLSSVADVTLTDGTTSPAELTPATVGGVSDVTATGVATGAVQAKVDTVAAAAASFTVDLASATSVEATKTYEMTICGQTVEGGATATATAAGLASSFAGEAIEIAGVTYTASVEDSTKVKWTAGATGLQDDPSLAAGAVTIAKGTTASSTDVVGAFTSTVDLGADSGKKVTIKDAAGEIGSQTFTDAQWTGDVNVSVTDGAGKSATMKIATGTVGTNLNGFATIANATAASGTGATTEIDYTGKTGGDAIGSTVKVGDVTYEFVKTGGAATGTNVAVEVDETDAAADIVDALDAKVKTNTNYAATNTAGKFSTTDGGDKLTITTWDTGDTVKALEVKQTGGGLTLQIGDTADSYNRLTVSVGDMHTEALGLKGVEISTLTGAQNAVQALKNAINTVSATRGDLGAIQNRLEHTANNLAVMEENITDAESTVRDTDVADEMMAYTKNNILIQSAQAMLAQANAVPQGVLQLLQ